MPEDLNAQNFVRQSGSVDLKPQKPQEFFKALALEILAFTSAVAFSFIFWLYTLGQTSFVLAAAVFLIFAILSTLELFLVKNLLRRFLVIILESLGLLSAFIINSRPLTDLLIVFLVLTIFHLFGELTGRHEEKSYIEQRFFKVSRVKLSKLATAITFFVVLLYLPSLNYQNIKLEEIIITPKNFKVVYNWASGFFKNMAPDLNLNLDSNVTDLAKSLAKSKLQNIPAYKDLNPADQQNALDKAAGEIIKNFSDNFKTTIETDKPSSDFFYNFLIQNLYNWKASLEKNGLGNWFLVGWLVLFFLIIRSIGAIFSFLAAGLTFIIIQLLLVIGFIKIKTESKTKESLTL
ncbi:MAG: hypothetical protein WCX12_01365 [Candidatus Paceibacterota bacterium]|jgi:hypothetical protein